MAPSIIESIMSKHVHSEAPPPTDAEEQSPSNFHAAIVLKEWSRLSAHVERKQPVYADNDDLNLSSVVAVSKHDTRVELENASSAIKRVNGSVEFLSQRLAHGHSLYGITTGFGGSADLHTTNTVALQQALVQHQQSGILPVVKTAWSIHARLRRSPAIDFMPEEWVRGTMLIRCKSLLAAHSAVRWEIIELLIALLNNNLIPLVPLRGSISASGDLQPLSYIAGVLEGNPDSYVWTSDESGGRDLIPADVALEMLHRQSVTFGAKEALAVLNGTAVSTVVAALALQEAHHLAILSQVLTAMGVEALLGSIGSFDPFFTKVRPHPGQAEVARNIQRFLVGSKLARGEEEDEDDDGLKQDRYALRTSSQWIGPQLEDLALAHKQITVECNSTTDNPLVDVEGDTMHHGGNFQAASVTSAMEKTRLSLQMFGRMLFSQCTELINPAMNKGLPPNLASDEPSTSYTMKGADINTAAYVSELAFLANPVSSHVQTAEMGNQGINSLAFISARYTHTAIDLLTMISASYLYVLCQALDLRAMNVLFLAAAAPALQSITATVFGAALLDDPAALEALQAQVLKQTLQQISHTAAMDSPARFHHVALSVQPTLTSHLCTRPSFPPDFAPLSAIQTWTTQTSSTLLALFTKNRTDYFARPDATPYLGHASTRMYRHVRQDLGVPFHTGLADRPDRANGLKGIGSNISIIYESMRHGDLYGEMLECLRGVMPNKLTMKGNMPNGASRNGNIPIASPINKLNDAPNGTPAPAPATDFIPNGI